jgi:RNA polymerase sigma-70 factor (ECF subfamily)
MRSDRSFSIAERGGYEEVRGRAEMKLVKGGAPKRERTHRTPETDRPEKKISRRLESAPKSAQASGDNETVRKLLDGDEATFGGLVARYNDTMISLARAHVPNRAVAEEVVQEAWLALLQGLGGFKGKSSLKTWLFGILINRARTRGKRERRSVSFSAIATLEKASNSECHEAWSSSFDRRWIHQSALSGTSVWSGSPEDIVLTTELRSCVEVAVAKLTPAQRIVLVLRDLEGWSAGEVCDLLEISPENQRVRLHRARLKIRDALSAHL